MHRELGGPVVTVRAADFLFAIAVVAAATVLLIVAGLGARTCMRSPGQATADALDKRRE
jgi:hypothetical protein